MLSHQGAGNQEEAARERAKKTAGVVQSVVDMVIADANKPFVIQHRHAIGDLVAGLLVDDDPLNRRAQDGAANLHRVRGIAAS